MKPRFRKLVTCAYDREPHVCNGFCLGPQPVRKKRKASGPRPRRRK